MTLGPILNVLVKERIQNGGTNGCTLVTDLWAGLQCEVAMTVGAIIRTATLYKQHLTLRQIQFMQDGVPYRAAWLVGYRLDEVPHFDDRVHIKWLVDNLPKLLENGGLDTRELADLMLSQGIELAPGVPIRRRGIETYIREAVGDRVTFETVRRRGKYVNTVERV